METQAQLQREVQEARHEAREAIKAKEHHAKEMANLKRAEEKTETLQLELEAAREKIKKLMEGGGGEGGGSGGVSQLEVKALQAQNEKLREKLVNMRDQSTHEKQELAKDLEEKVAQLAVKTKVGHFRYRYFLPVTC